ncbi:hypothetical protein PMIN01_04233 [Paraphaeosphaeria minitans]|uniref:Uncharacterized protein n=1 Tax=Paraphaeosphaeria minitans TaxID=565426 RepID=A0A9P6GJB4_9PLEO|nr:hypothetical protein PMIN01_04233 [Paraphaeosphaeria minitans]
MRPTSLQRSDNGGKKGVWPIPHDVGRVTWCKRPEAPREVSLHSWRRSGPANHECVLPSSHLQGQDEMRDEDGIDVDVDPISQTAPWAKDEAMPPNEMHGESVCSIKLSSPSILTVWHTCAILEE